MKRKLSLSTLPELDSGIVNEAFTKALERCEADCRDRPGDDKPRKVTLVVEMTPVRDQRGRLDSINVGVDVSDAIPKRRSKLFNMLPRHDGLMFDELSPDDAHQESLDMED